MSTMNLSLPDTLVAFVDEQVATRGFSTRSEYVQELIRHDRDRFRLRERLIEGAESPLASPADQAYFDGLRDRVGVERDVRR